MVDRSRLPIILQRLRKAVDIVIPHIRSDTEDVLPSVIWLYTSGWITVEEIPVYVLILHPLINPLVEIWQCLAKGAVAGMMQRFTRLAEM